MAILLALLSSLLWGSGDFCGGTASRRLPSHVVVFGSQVVGLLLAAIGVLTTGAYHDPTGYLPWAVGAGISGVAGLLFFYRALAIGTMGVVSPIAALSVLVPVIIAIRTGQSPSVIVGVGIVFAILGIVMLSGPERGTRTGLAPAWMAGGAAICFGFAVVLHRSRLGVLDADDHGRDASQFGAPARDHRRDRCGDQVAR